jgi:hypothetical protein
MSVLGEFDRHLGLCIDFLEATDSEVAYAWATRMLEVRVIARDDLNVAAKRVLSFRSAEPSIEAIEFPSARESESFRAVWEPMLELSGRIAGVPVDIGAD